MRKVKDYNVNRLIFNYKVRFFGFYSFFYYRLRFYYFFNVSLYNIRHVIFIL